MSESNPWDEHAAGWDDDPGARAYAAAAFESLVAALDERCVSLEGARVCDFGCGTGLLTEWMVAPARWIDAVDTSPAMLARISTKIRERGWANVRPSAIPPSSTGTHDVVVCSSVLGFVDDYPGTAERLSALLAPGGIFVQWDWERDRAGIDPTGLSRDEIHDALVAAGLVAVSVEEAFEISLDGVTARPVMGVGRRRGGPGLIPG